MRRKKLKLKSWTSGAFLILGADHLKMLKVDNVIKRAHYYMKGFKHGNLNAGKTTEKLHYF